MKKYLFIVFSIPFLLNLGFLLTDKLAGEIIDWKAIFYSPVSNENWLEFWAIFLSTIVTFFLLLHYHKELQFNKKKIIYENIIETLKRENEIVLEYLYEIETTDISEIILLAEKFITKKVIKKEIEDSILNICDKKREKIKKLNYIQLKLDLTSLRIKEDKMGNKINELEELRDKSYKSLILLKGLYANFLENISNCMIQFLNEINEDEINEDEINEDEINEDEINEDEINEDEINEDEINKRNENFNKLINKVNKDFYDLNKRYIKYGNSYEEKTKIMEKNIEIIHFVFKEAINNFQTYYVIKLGKNNEILLENK